MIDLTFKASDIIQIVVLAGGGLIMITMLRSSVNALTREFAKLEKAFERITERVDDMADLKTRVLRCEEDIRELRHGDGIVLKQHHAR